jgi:L-lactate dehydrogenase complex protein LldG
MSARDNILARIVKARQAAGHDIESEIRRHPRGPVPPLAGDLASCFDEQAVKLSSDVAHAGTITEIPGIVAQYLRQHDLPRQGVCWPVLAPYDWRSAGIELQARGAREDDMLGITGAFVGIAETGTLMLLSPCWARNASWRPWNRPGTGCASSMERSRARSILFPDLRAQRISSRP